MTNPITLTHLTLIRIHGDDSAQFLQGQLTNDVHIGEDQWQFTGYCNPKGRLLGVFQLWRTEQAFFILMEASLAARLLKRLTMYVLRSDVKIDALTAAKITGHILDTTPNTAQPGAHMVETVSATRHRLWYTGRHIDVDIDGSAPTTAQDALLHTWLAADIAEGLPRVTDTTTEQFVPQMINLDALNGINFKKGCYTGQEIVARMHYLGKLKQRMFLCKLSTTSSVIAPGDKVYANNDDAEPGPQTGTIVSAIPGYNYLLAVFRIEQLDGNHTLIDGTSMSVVADQPYLLPAARQKP
ncbi:folate-binding protein [Arenicella chitinivorans]|uniref:Folate-binding protein n=1 Tax=Arenicella chitinivorans TaxID=1329800 RepID=A0A918RTN5_9GAMM|nr:folate-binding protein YgfZ [Arenicella chitinivorans]GHA08986.1 folate-binding protein [Arenicella chitinivorans]